MSIKTKTATVQVTVSFDFEFDEESNIDINDQAAESLGDHLFDTGMRLVEYEGIKVLGTDD